MRPLAISLLAALVATMAALPAGAAEPEDADIVVIGGVGAIGPGVLEHLAGCTEGEVTRIAGTDRYETAAAIATAWDTAPTVYLATGERYPDAIAIGAVAAKERAPILLTRRDALSPASAAQIRRLAPAEVVIVGGPAAVSMEVERQVADLGPTVVRWAGDDRYGTAVAISSSRFSPGVDVVHVVTGESFTDGLVAGPMAAPGPILLVPPSHIPASVAAELTRLDPIDIVVVGGDEAVTAATEAALTAYATGGVARISGPTRYATAAALSTAAAPGSVYVVRADDYPDGLAVAGLAGERPILLSDGTDLPEATSAEVGRLTGAECTPWRLDALLRPVSGPITSGFGLRLHPIFGGYRMHNGIDFDVEAGTPIVASADGTVIHSGEKGGYGLTVMVEHGGGFVTLYAHMRRIGAPLGRTIRAGEVIGWVGSTGHSTGPHLHFEVRIDDRPENPVPYFG